MTFELLHRPRTTVPATRVEVDAPSSAAAIEAVRSAIPADHVILFVRDLDMVVPRTRLSTPGLG